MSDERAEHLWAPEIDRWLRALAYLADPDSWLGDPHDQTAVLLGHDTPFELARQALGRA